MTSDDKVPMPVVHLIFMGCTCLALFPMGPILYLAVITLYYGVANIHLAKRPLILLLKYALLIAFWPVVLVVWLTKRAVRHVRRQKEERLYREREAERQKLRAAEKSAQQRRDDARSECELLYSLYAPEIAGRFPRKSLDTYMQKYMNDEEEPSRVESRAVQLRQVMQQHKDHAEPPERFASLGELTTWFEEQKKQLETCPDDRMRRSLLVQLKERYSELSAELLEQI